MASNDVEVLDPAAPVEKNTTSGFELDRRHFIAALGVAGAAAGTALISSSKAQAQQPIPNGYAQVDVINLMLQIKYLKATLYSYITQGTDLPGASQVTVGTGAVYQAPAKITTFPQQIADLFNEMYYDELNQLIALRAQQGVAVAPRQTINLLGTGPSGGSTLPAATSTLTPAQAIALSRMLEDLSTSAFATATNYLTGTNLALAMQALASDGAHAGAIRLLAIQTGAQYQGTQYGSVTTSTSAQSAVTFSGQLIAGNNVIYATLPTNVPLVGSVATGIGIPPGAGAVITAVTSAPNLALTAISSKSATLTLVSSVAGLAAGQPITGTFIPAGTYIQSVGTNTITLTNAPGTTTVPTTGSSTVAPTGFVTNGSPTITGVSSTTGLIVGQPITGTGIPSGATISAFSSSAATITMSANATVTSSISLSGALTSGSNTVTGLSTTSGLIIGQPISGTGIPANTTITGVGSSSLTMSNNATATSPLGTATFTGIVTSGKATITLVPSTTGLAVGQVVGGPGITAGTTITTISGTTVTMSANATANSTIPITAANVTSGSNIVSGLGSVTGIITGQTITGTGIPASTTVTAIGSNTITISSNATLTNVGAAYTVTAPETIYAGGQLLTTPTTEAVTSPTTEAISIGVTQITLAGPATVTGVETISIVVPDAQDVEPGDPGSAAISAGGPSAVAGTSPALYQGFFNTAGAATTNGTTPPGFAFARSFQQILSVLYGYNSTNSNIATQNYEGGFYPFGVSGNITSAI